MKFIAAKLTEMSFILVVIHDHFLKLLGLLQRILEQRVSLVLDRVLVKPMLTSPPPVEEGGLLQVRMLVIDTLRVGVRFFDFRQHYWVDSVHGVQRL